MNASPEHNCSGRPELRRWSRAVASMQRLQWLAPCADTLVALARHPVAAAWSDRVHLDPAGVLLLLRSIPPSESSNSPVWASTLEDPLLFDNALRCLEPGPSTVFLDWTQNHLQNLLQQSWSYASLSRRLAHRTGQVDPDRAWIGGLLAPLGSVLLAQFDDRPLEENGSDPAGWQPPTPEESIAVTRWAIRRWELPEWLVHLLSCLGLSPRIAAGLGGDPLLIQHVQAAVELSAGSFDQTTILDRRLTRQAIVGLELAHQALQEVMAESAGRIAEYRVTWEDPRKVGLLPDLLAVARENKRLQGGRLFAKLEEDNNLLNEALARQVQSEEDRLRHTCLAALGELAAGAGHEINNPLAVISGQAQYLLGHEHDWFVEPGQVQVRDSLQAIIAQTRRIHGLLRDLMLFARPPSPRWEWVDLARLIGEVAASFRDASESQGIRLEVDCPLERLLVKGDQDMLRQALSCLVRNATEAVPSPGWVRLVLSTPQPEQPVEVRVEDSGPGPNAEQQKHLFDPFYSGRNSGRGKGMGLPIAWRLAQCHGGDVRLEMSPSQPTTFVLSLTANQNGPPSVVSSPGNIVQALPDRRFIVNAAG